MIALRFDLLADAPRRALALALAGLSIAAPAALIFISVAGLADRASARAALTEEVATLRGALAERVAEAGPAGAKVSPDAASAEQALEARADALAAAFDGAGVRLIARERAQPVEAGGVAERRLTLGAAGSADALAAALSEAARDPDLAVSFAEFDALETGEVRVRLTLVEVLAQPSEAGR